MQRSAFQTEKTLELVQVPVRCPDAEGDAALSLKSSWTDSPNMTSQDGLGRVPLSTGVVQGSGSRVCHRGNRLGGQQTIFLERPESRTDCGGSVTVRVTATAFALYHVFVERLAEEPASPRRSSVKGSRFCHNTAETALLPASAQTACDDAA